MRVGARSLRKLTEEGPILYGYSANLDKIARGETRTYFEGPTSSGEEEPSRLLKYRDALRAALHDNEPPREALSRAATCLDALASSAEAATLRWSEPHLNVSPDDEIVFEWWNADRKLTMYISGESAQFIKVWGANIDSEMEDGYAESSEELSALWNWLQKKG